MVFCSTSMGGTIDKNNIDGDVRGRKEKWRPGIESEIVSLLERYGVTLHA